MLIFKLNFVLNSLHLWKDFDEDYKGAMAIKQGTYIGVTRAEAIKHKTEYNDGWIKVTNLETEACGYIPVAYMKFNSGQSD